MIRVLIVDDNNVKQSNIAAVVDKVLSGRDDIEIKSVACIIDAKQTLSKTNIDIMILDICLPLRFRDKPIRDGGIKMLTEVNGSDRYTYPKFVISLSEHEDLTREFSLQSGIIHTAIYYNITSNEWSIRLAECVKTAISIMSNNIFKRTYDFDVAVICALKEELEFVKADLNDVKEYRLTDDDYIFYTGYFQKESKKIKVVMTQSTHMGMVPAASLTTRLIHNFVPRYIVMTGIAAGIHNKVNMGDIVVAEYVWDYGAGKETIVGEEAIHNNTIQQVTLDTEIAHMVKRLSSDVTALAEIKRKFHGTKPSTELNLHLVPVATGAAVIANPEKVKMIQEQIRDVVAIEMEIYGVYYAARWAIKPKPKYIAIKSICDFADTKKNDDFHNYASFTSAKIFEKLAVDYFEYDD